MGAPRDLREFLELLESHGEVRRVSAPVDPELEITEIYDRVVKRGGPALLFENVRESSIPVLINALGSDRRVQLALGGDPRTLGEELARILRPSAPRGIREGWRTLRSFLPLLHAPPKKVSRAPCQEVVRTGNKASFEDLPILRTWPKDAGRYITWGLVFTEDPEGGERNVGVYRVQIVGPKEALLHWQTHKHGRMHFERARKMGWETFPVSIVVGCAPSTVFSATAPLPPGMDELLLSGILQKRRVRVVRCVTNDLAVPAESEIVLEGHVMTKEPFRIEGPFGDHTGFYSPPDLFPVFHLDAITHRVDPIYLTTAVGVPPHEDAAVGRAIERMFVPLLRFLIPHLVELHLPVTAAFHNLALVSVRKPYPGAQRSALMGLWGAGMLSLEKCVLLFDEGFDVSRTREAILWAFENVDWERDLILLDSMPTDTLDHASRFPDLSSHMALDLTTPHPHEPPRRPKVDPRPIEGIEKEFPSILSTFSPSSRITLLSILKEGPPSVREVLTGALRKGWGEGRLLVAFDPDVPIEDEKASLFHFAASFDPVRDLVLERGPRGVLSAGIDATRKTPKEGGRAPWPDLVVMDDRVRNLVTQRFPEYGLDPQFRDPVPPPQRIFRAPGGS